MLDVSALLARRAMFKHAKYILITLLAYGTVHTAEAQQGSPGPRLDPALLEKQFEEFRLQRRSAQPGVRLPTVAPPPPTTTGTGNRFQLSSIVTDGSSLLPEEKLAAIYRPYLGRLVSEADLAAIANQITELYRSAGFHLSRALVPAQEIKNGVVRISLIEGYIAQVNLRGSNTKHAAVLLHALTAERPSRLPTVERQLLLISDLPGFRIGDIALEEIGTATGVFRLTVDIETWGISGLAAINNSGTAAVGPLQSHFSTAVNSYVLPGDALGMNLAAVPDTPRELSFGQLWYDAPLGIAGARLGLSAAHGEIRPSDFRRHTDTRTRSTSFDLRVSSNPIRTRKSSVWLVAGLGMLNASEEDDRGEIYHDRIRTATAGTTAQFEDLWQASNHLTLTVRQGLGWLDGSQSGDDLLSRSDASAEFTKVELSFVRIQKLSDDWSVKLASAAQWSSTALLASQEFYLGGPIFGRGYSSGELGGDEGAAASLELRFDQRAAYKLLEAYQLYAFVDGGAVRNLGKGEDGSASLVSAGAGIRFDFVGDFEADVGVAVPLTYRSPLNRDRELRFYFALTKAFRLCPDRALMQCG
jgi:hemolysin activation/secretion protein